VACLSQGDIHQIANAISVIELLEEAGYCRYDVEDEKPVKAAALGRRAPSHPFCSKEVDHQQQGCFVSPAISAEKFN
jgi:hypothetical protein